VSNVVYNTVRRRGFSIMHAYLLRYVSAAEVLRAGARLASLVSRCDSCERCRCDADADAMPWSA
jgi:hypothetical protein